MENETSIYFTSKSLNKQTDRVTNTKAAKVLSALYVPDSGIFDSSVSIKTENNKLSNKQNTKRKKKYSDIEVLTEDSTRIKANPLYEQGVVKFNSKERKQTVQYENNFVYKPNSSRKEVPYILGSTIIVCIILLILATTVREDPLFPSELPLLEVEGRDINIMEKNSHVFYDLNISDPGRYCIFAISFLNPDLPGFVSLFDPTLSLYKRPEQFLQFSDNIGAKDVNPVIFFEIEEGDQDKFVADVSSVREEGEGEFVIGLLRVSDIPLRDNQAGIFFVSGDGASFFLARLEAGVSYSIAAFGINDEPFHEDVFNTVLRIRDSEGIEVDLGFQSTSRDLSARVLFTPSKTDDYIYEIRTLDFFQGDFVVKHMRLNLTNVNLEEQSTFLTVNDIAFANSTDYLVEFKKDHEYNFVFTENMNEQLLNNPLNFCFCVNDFERNISYFSPIFYPGVAVRIEDFNTGERLFVAETELEFNVFNLNEEERDTTANLTVSSAGPLTFTYRPEKDLTAILDVISVNPFYAPNNDNFIFGSYTMEINVVEVEPEPEVSLDQPALVNVFDPFETCEVQPDDFVSGGCEAGIVIFCRQEIYPFRSFVDATVDQANQICGCVQSLCTGLRNTNRGNTALIALRTVVLVTFAVLCLYPIGVMAFVTYEMISYPNFRQSVLSRYNIHNWILCLCFYTLFILAVVMDLILQEPIKIFEQINANFVEQVSDLLETTPDIDYYSLSATPEVIRSPTVAPTIFVNEPLFEDNAVSIIPAGFSLQQIEAELLTFITAETLFQAIALLIFLEICVQWLTMGTAATFIARRRRQERVRKVLLVLRSIEGCLIGYTVFFVISTTSSKGANYNNSISILSSIICIGIIGTYLFARKYIFKRFDTTQGIAEMASVTSEADKEAISKFLNLIMDTSLVILLMICGLVMLSRLTPYLILSKLKVIQFLHRSHDETKAKYISVVLGNRKKGEDSTSMPTDMMFRTWNTTEGALAQQKHKSERNSFWMSKSPLSIVSVRKLSKLRTVDLSSAPMTSQSIFSAHESSNPQQVKSPVRSKAEVFSRTGSQNIGSLQEFSSKGTSNMSPNLKKPSDYDTLDRKLSSQKYRTSINN
eukprot:snap_masked-scaffold_46-processed-gene-1.48-mRNA-1 protein AED:1.00 eAED:1.00 QI:0/0/0/0/1/1/8/0/1102